MGRKYLVTGGTGFIGSAIVKRLVRENYKVKVLDNNSRGTSRRLNKIINDIEYVDADIRNADAVYKAAEGVDCIIHLAYINGTEFFYSEPDLVLDVAVRGMLNVLDACCLKGVRNLILASSSEVYQTPPYIPTDETVPLSIPDVLNPRYSYGGGKIISELMVINYGRTKFDRVIIFRPHNVYGPDMGWEHVLPQFILRSIDTIAATPEGPIPFSIQGDGRQTRAFIYIDDFVEGLMCVIKYGKHLNIYNIGNPEELTISEVARRVVGYFGREVLIKEGSHMKGGTQRRCPDISKIKALGFNPHISFNEGFPSIASWYQKNLNLRPGKYVGGT